MVEIQRTNILLKNIFMVVMLTTIPVILIIQLWRVITEYGMFILAIFLIGSGSLFIFFYFKAYSLKLIIIKVKEFFNIKDVGEEALTRKTENNEIKEKRNNFLYAGITMGVTGIFLLARFIGKY